MRPAEVNRDRKRTTTRIKLLPRSIDNDYSGTRMALWFFIVFTALTLIRSLIHVIAPDGGVRNQRSRCSINEVKEDAVIARI